MMLLSSMHRAVVLRQNPPFVHQHSVKCSNSQHLRAASISARISSQVQLSPCSRRLHPCKRLSLRPTSHAGDIGGTDRGDGSSNIKDFTSTLSSSSYNSSFPDAGPTSTSSGAPIAPIPLPPDDVLLPPPPHLPTDHPHEPHSVPLSSAASTPPSPSQPLKAVGDEAAADAAIVQAFISPPLIPGPFTPAAAVSTHGTDAQHIPAATIDSISSAAVDPEVKDALQAAAEAAAQAASAINDPLNQPISTLIIHPTPTTTTLVTSSVPPLHSETVGSVLDSSSLDESPFATITPPPLAQRLAEPTAAPSSLSDVELPLSELPPTPGGARHGHPSPTSSLSALWKVLTDTANRAILLFVVFGSLLGWLLLNFATRTAIPKVQPWNFTVQLSTAMGVRPGIPVTLRGVQIGSVTAARALTSHVELDVQVYAKSTHIPRGSTAEFNIVGMFSDPGVSIVLPASYDAPARSTDPLDVSACRRQGAIICNGDIVPGQPGGSSDELMHRFVHRQRGEIHEFKST